MIFRSRTVIWPVYIFDLRTAAKITLDVERNISATFRQEEVEGRGLQNILEIQADFEPPRKVGPQLEAFKAGDYTGRQYEDLPSPLTTFCESLYLDFTEVSKRVFGAVRWRLGCAGPPRLPPPFLFEWSADGESWSPLLIHYTMTGGISVHIPIERYVSEIEGLLNRAVDPDEAVEPLAHLMLLEARASMADSSLDSALVIGMAAMEIHVKQLVSDLIPEAKWLVEKVQSPPVDKMLKEFLPTLPVRPPSVNVALPDDMLTTIKGAVSSRNDVVHTIHKPLKRNSVQRTLQVIEDVLWLCDFYRGYAFAVAHIANDDFREALKTAAGGTPVPIS